MTHPSITIRGNLVRPVELRFTPSGAAVASFAVATSERRKTQSGDWEDVGESAFWDCSIWRQAAERLGDLAWQKGHPVIVTGRIKQRTYETRDGGKGRAFEVEVESVGTDEAALARRGGGSRPAAAPAVDPWAKTSTGADPWAAKSAPDEAPF